MGSEAGGGGLTAAAFTAQLVTYLEIHFELFWQKIELFEAAVEGFPKVRSVLPPHHHHWMT